MSDLTDDMAAEAGHWAAFDNTGGGDFVCECGLPWTADEGCPYVQGLRAVTERWRDAEQHVDQRLAELVRMTERAEAAEAKVARARAEGAYQAMWSFFLRLPAPTPWSDRVQREAMRLRAALDGSPAGSGGEEVERAGGRHEPSEVPRSAATGSGGVSGRSEGGEGL